MQMENNVTIKLDSKIYIPILKIVLPTGLLTGIIIISVALINKLL